MDLLSSFEQLVMLAAFRQHPNGYGVSIKEELLSETGKDYSIGSIYSVLERLERKGFVKTRVGEPEAKRGGRSKLYFSLTGIGQSALNDTLRAVDAMRIGFSFGGAFA